MATSKQRPTLTMAALLQDVPAKFRAALKLARAGSIVDLGALHVAAQAFENAQQPCSACDRCQCRAIAAEVAALGGERAAHGVRHVNTSAQAAFFLARSLAWIRAREPAQAPESEVATPLLLQHHAFASYDTSRYDFRAIVMRILSDHLGHDGEDPLATLHLSPAGRCERGYLSEWLDEGATLTYSQEIDEATRYGCGAFNRAWKSAQPALRAEFLATYERFLAEVVAPMLGCDDGGLVYQAVPVFRVFLPGHLGIGPRHTDAQYHEQANELNFWIPLTASYASNSLQVESRPGVGDFEPIDACYGTLFRFRGNACEHYTELNVEGCTRVSFDFRVIRPQELPSWPVATAPAVNDTARGKAAHFTIGEGRYYRRLPQAQSPVVEAS